MNSSAEDEAGLYMVFSFEAAGYGGFHRYTRKVPQLAREGVNRVEFTLEGDGDHRRFIVSSWLKPVQNGWGQKSPRVNPEGGTMHEMQLKHPRRTRTNIGS
jgi:hypothetical protein